MPHIPISPVEAIVDETSKDLRFFLDIMDRYKPLIKENMDEAEQTHSEINRPGCQPFGIPNDADYEQKLACLKQFCTQESTSLRHTVEMALGASAALNQIVTNAGLGNAEGPDEHSQRKMSYEPDREPPTSGYSYYSCPPGPFGFGLGSMVPLPDEKFTLPEQFTTSPIDKESVLSQIKADVFSVIDKLYIKECEEYEGGQNIQWLKLIGCMVENGKKTFKVAFLDVPYLMMDEEEFFDHIHYSTELYIE